MRRGTVTMSKARRMDVMHPRAQWIRVMLRTSLIHLTPSPSFPIITAPSIPVNSNSAVGIVFVPNLSFNRIIRTPFNDPSSFFTLAQNKLTFCAPGVFARRSVISLSVALLNHLNPFIVQASLLEGYARVSVPEISEPPVLSVIHCPEVHKSEPLRASNRGNE